MPGEHLSSPQRIVRIAQLNRIAMTADTSKPMNHPPPPDFPPPPPPLAKSKKRPRTQEAPNHVIHKKFGAGEDGTEDANYVVYGSDDDEEQAPGNNSTMDDVEGSSSNVIMDDPQHQRKRARPSINEAGEESGSDFENKVEDREHSLAEKDVDEGEGESQTGQQSGSQTGKRSTRRTSQNWRKDTYKPVPSSPHESDSDLDVAEFGPRPKRGGKAKGGSVTSNKLQKAASTARRAKSTPDLKGKAPIRAKSRKSKFIEGSMGDRHQRAVPPPEEEDVAAEEDDIATEAGPVDEMSKQREGSQLRSMASTDKLKRFDFTDTTNNPADDIHTPPRSKFTFTAVFTPLFSSLKTAWHAARAELEEKEREKERQKEEARRNRAFKSRAFKKPTIIKEEPVDDVDMENGIGMAISHNEPRRSLSYHIESVTTTIHGRPSISNSLPPSPDSLEANSMNASIRTPRKPLTPYRQSILTKRLEKLEKDLQATRTELADAGLITEETPLPSMEYPDDGIVLSGAEGEDDSLHENTLIKNGEPMAQTDKDGSHSPSQSRAGSPAKKSWFGRGKSRDRSTTPKTAAKGKKGAALVDSGKITKTNTKGKGASMRGRGRLSKTPNV